VVENFPNNSELKSDFSKDDITIQNIVTLLLEKKKVQYKFKTNHDPLIQYLHAILHRIFSELDLSFLTETIYVIVLELISNFLKVV
jgi:hypothetical protein